MEKYGGIFKIMIIIILFVISFLSIRLIKYISKILNIHEYTALVMYGLIIITVIIFFKLITIIFHR